jgi:outer membrane lipoprotein carrier protein
MAIVKPGKFYWYTKNPTEQKIVANGDKVWIYDIDLEQATLKTIDNSSDSAPALLLSGSVDKLKEKYTITYITKGALKGWYRLLPKNKDSDFQEISMHFTNNALDKMSIKDNLAETTSLSFTNVKINGTVSPKLFTLTFPKNVDVIQ